MSRHKNDFLPGATVRIPFNTSASDGSSVTIATNGTVRVYKDGGTTEITTGASLVEDFDGITGIHFAVIDTSADANYTAGADYDVAIVNNTIDGKSVSAWIGSFSLGRRTYSTPVVGLAQAGASGSVTLPATASATDSFYNGAFVTVASGTGAGQSRMISGYTGSTKVATVDPNWTTNPDTTSVVVVTGAPPAQTSSPMPVNVTKLNNVALNGAGTTGSPWGP